MVSIDWANRVIHIPKSSLSEVSSNRYTVDINNLHKWLKDIEDDDDGIVNPDTHVYYKPIVVGGTTIARSVEIINGYTVTFENGSYLVDVVGGNSNILDVLNFNNVSVRANNSAGMVEVGTSSNVNVVSVNGKNIESITDIAKEVWDYEIE